MARLPMKCYLIHHVNKLRHALKRPGHNHGCFPCGGHTMDQMAIPPIAMAAPISNKLYFSVSAIWRPASKGTRLVQVMLSSV